MSNKEKYVFGGFLFVFFLFCIAFKKFCFLAILTVTVTCMTVCEYVYACVCV